MDYMYDCALHHLPHIDGQIGASRSCILVGLICMLRESTKSTTTMVL